MLTEINNNINNLVVLQHFTVFPEYFISVTIFYVLIVMTLITYNVYGLLIQKSISECIALILLMTCFLIYNDDIVINSSLEFTNEFIYFNNTLKNDFLSIFCKFLICFFSAGYFFLIADSLKEQKLIYFEYLIIILFAVIGLMLMCNSYDLLTAYLTIELSSLSFYLLASFRKTSTYSIEAGIKYFVTGAVSSAFFLLGSSLIYFFSGSINFETFSNLYNSRLFDQSNNVFNDYGHGIIYFINLYSQTFKYIFENSNYFILDTTDSSFLEIGLAFLLFSIFIKLSLAPFHLWSLDVYEGSPTNSTIFFAVISKLSLFVLLIRICYASFPEFSDCWAFYCIWVGVLSVFIGSFGGLTQRKLKTLIAYSSISHMGYNLIVFSTNSFFGMQSILFYMIVYMLSGLSVWSIVLLLRLKRNNTYNKYSKELGDLILLKKSNPSLAFSLSLSIFSLAGIPPMLGFLSKLIVFLPVIGINYYLVASTSILISVISTFYYIRIIKILYFESILVGKLYYPISGLKTIILSLFIILLIFLFVNPNLIYLLSHKVFLLMLHRV